MKRSNKSRVMNIFFEHNDLYVMKEFLWLWRTYCIPSLSVKLRKERGNCRGVLMTTARIGTIVADSQWNFACILVFADEFLERARWRTEGSCGREVFSRDYSTSRRKETIGTSALIYLLRSSGGMQSARFAPRWNKAIFPRPSVRAAPPPRPLKRNVIRVLLCGLTRACDSREK